MLYSIIYINLIYSIYTIYSSIFNPGINMSKPIIFTVANQKGGVGKSTLTALFSMAFVRDKKKKVGIVDTDPQKSLYKLMSQTEAPIKFFSYDLESFVAMEIDKNHELSSVDIPADQSTFNQRI